MKKYFAERISELNYYLGISIGTNSVSWAVTDEHYNILRKKGKDLWGVRTFDAAQTAKECRNKRGQRRRLLRKKVRLGYLKCFFHDEITKVDPDFFFRLSESKYHTEDKKTGTKYTIFNDEGYNDTTYFAQYPTIFHLRKALIESKDPHDIRLLFIALAHMFQHRGHFLQPGLSLDNLGGEIESLFSEAMEQVRDLEEDAINPSLRIDFDVENIKEMENILSDRMLTKTEKLELLAEKLSVSKKEKAKYEILKALCGHKIKPSTLFSDLFEFDDDEKKISFSFCEEIEEHLGNLENVLSPESIDFLYTLKTIHDIGCLAGIMQGHEYLSYARVESYEKHKSDLKCLKKIIRAYRPDLYNDMFRSMKEWSYSAYVGSVNSDKKQRRFVEKDKRFSGTLTNKSKDKKRDVFYIAVKQIMESIPDCDEKTYILNEIERESFMPKQMTGMNGIIPNQLHLAELQEILKNAEEYHPFLKEKDSDGLSISDKIIIVFTFYIPFYNGPLSNTETNRGWMERAKMGPIHPWNFSEMVDLPATREKFMDKLINTCTYLRDEKVLPKMSLMYERYIVLNALNVIRISGKRLTVAQKQDMFNTLFLSGKQVTRKTIEQYCVKVGLISEGMESEIAGIDDECKLSLSSYAKFYRIFGEELNNPDVQEMAEQIILWNVVFGKEKQMFMDVVREAYGHILTEEQLKQIKGLKFKEWGRLSHEFLTLNGSHKKDKVVRPLIDMLWESNKNLMELLSDEYTYQDTLKAITYEAAKSLEDITYDDLDGMYLTPPVKRSIWQAILIVKEIVSVMGHVPQKLFIDMARGDVSNKKGKGKKRRTPSRKEQLLTMYSNLSNNNGKGKKKKLSPFLTELVETLKTYDEKELSQNNKLYLYFLQQGRCMYTGEIIDLELLMSSNGIYDIDHIYPKHFTKDSDGSVHDNLVLARKDINGGVKQDIYPLPETIYLPHMWTQLKNDGFMSSEKYRRLMNRTPFTDEQLIGFISRQIVETRQSCKTFAHLMEKTLGSEVAYIKSSAVSDFRGQFKIFKSRAVNPFHAAEDAYLNIVVGNTYNVKFTKNPTKYIQEYRKNPKDNHYHMDKIFQFDVQRNGEIAWIAKGPDKTIDTVNKMINKQTPLITRMPYEAHGSFYNETKYSKKVVNSTYIPLNSTDERMQDMSKYGGFTSISGTYFFLVEHDAVSKKQTKRIRTLEFMPLYLKEKIGEDKKSLEIYCEETLGLKNPDVRLIKIKLQSMMRINGYYMLLSGRSTNRLSMRNAVSLCLDRKWTNYISRLEKSVQKQYVMKSITAEKNVELYNLLIQKMQNPIFSKRPNNQAEALLKYKAAFIALDIDKQCYTLCEILKLFAHGVLKADLSEIGGVENAGAIVLNKNITENKECVLLCQSPTGLYEREFDLLTI